MREWWQAARQSLPAVHLRRQLDNAAQVPPKSKDTIHHHQFGDWTPLCAFPSLSQLLWNKLLLLIHISCALAPPPNDGAPGVHVALPALTIKSFRQLDSQRLVPC
jgi:hypothetical protein